MNQRLVFHMWVFFSVLLFVSPGESGYCRHARDIGQYGMGCIQRQAQGFRPAPAPGDEGVYDDNPTFGGEVTTVGGARGGDAAGSGDAPPAHGEAGHVHNAAAEKTLLEGELAIISKQIGKVQDLKAKKDRNERYAMIKKYNCVTGYFDTYMVDLEAHGGPKILDKFSTTMSSRGVGCAKNHTRPGIFRLNKFGEKCQTKGSSEKDHWGNGFKVFCVVRVDDKRNCDCPDCFMHSNRHMRDPCKQSHVVAQTGRRVCTPHPSKPNASKSYGCTVTTEGMFRKFHSGNYKHFPGNTLIYNPTKAEFSKQAAECRGPRR